MQQGVVVVKPNFRVDLGGSLWPGLAIEDKSMSRRSYCMPAIEIRGVVIFATPALSLPVPPSLSFSSDRTLQSLIPPRIVLCNVNGSRVDLPHDTSQRTASSRSQLLRLYWSAV